jgi:hypothetical protein
MAADNAGQLLTADERMLATPLTITDPLNVVMRALSGTCAKRASDSVSGAPYAGVQLSSPCCVYPQHADRRRGGRQRS